MKIENWKVLLVMGSPAELAKDLSGFGDLPVWLIGIDKASGTVEAGGAASNYVDKIRAGGVGLVVTSI